MPCCGGAPQPVTGARAHVAEPRTHASRTRCHPIQRSKKTRTAAPVRLYPVPPSAVGCKGRGRDQARPVPASCLRSCAIEQRTYNLCRPRN
uniref:Uncharacterized protein n=1 Tax=Arundo donax TaxID=35708 RepID=A0A0A9BTF9_ARUDO